MHPAYDTLFDGFAAPEVRGNPKARTRWAVDQMKKAIKASKNLGLTAVPTFSGALLWQTMYPWPQRPAGLVDLGFTELAKRWKPILDFADQHGVDLAYEIHPGEDLHDGNTFEHVPRQGGRARAREHAATTRRTTSSSASTTWRTSTSTTTASRRST